MCLQNAVEGILGTSVSWADFEKQIKKALGTEARLGPKKSVLDIGDGKGYASCCGLITCDWVDAAPGEKLPRTVVLKMNSTKGLRRLNELMPEGQKMFNYTDEQWARMEISMSAIHNRECATYEFFEEFEGLAVPRKYYGKHVEEGSEVSGQLCLGFIENSQMMRFHEKHTVEQVRQIARALGKLQACSLKKEATAPELQMDFWTNMGNVFPLETYIGMFKGLLAIDNSEKTRSLMDKIAPLLPVYHGANLASTIHKQMGFRPVIVNADLHTGNVLIDKDTGDLAALIDWQCTHLGVGVEDLHRIAMSALTTEERRASMPMLVEEMYKSMVENLDGTEVPYSLITLLLVSDILYPHCALFFASIFIALIKEKEDGISEEEDRKRRAIKLDKAIGCLEDVVQFDVKNKNHVGGLKFKYDL